MDGIKINGGISDEQIKSIGIDGNAIEQVLFKFGQQLQDDLIDSLDQKRKNASGTLRQSIEALPKVSVNDGLYTYQLKMEDYYEYVDEGRKAGKQPPLESIVKWVRQKSAFGGLGVNESKDVNSVAFMIARKIGKFGIKPTHFFTNVINDGRLKQLTKDLTKAGAQGLNFN